MLKKIAYILIYLYLTFIDQNQASYLLEECNYESCVVHLYRLNEQNLADEEFLNSYSNLKISFDSFHHSPFRYTYERIIMKDYTYDLKPAFTSKFPFVSFFERNKVECFFSIYKPSDDSVALKKINDRKIYDLLENLKNKHLIDMFFKTNGDIMNAIEESKNDFIVKSIYSDWKKISNK